MNLCLVFHCLCESYNDIPDREHELFVSLPDLEDLIKELKRRGFSFDSIGHPGSKTVTVTFDDGYYNNLLFEDLAKNHGVPYLVFPSVYYNLTGDVFPWFQDSWPTYAGVEFVDYYKHFYEIALPRNSQTVSESIRPMDFLELDRLNRSELAEIGCHGYYHQALSKSYEHYLWQERDLALSCLKEKLDIKPRYFSLANGAYTKRVMRELLETFDRILTIEGRPYRKKARIVHRITLLNPTTAGTLVDQIDRHLFPLRQLKRTFKSFIRMRL